MKRYCLFFASLWAASSQVAIADDYVARYLCYADGKIRQNGAGAPVNSRFEMKLMKDEKGLIYLTQALGHVLVTDETGPSILADRYGYYALFRFGRLYQNPDYNPVVYHDHYQFKPFNAVTTNGFDGGGMWGSFVLPKSLNKEVSAHYIFQAGSHIGGTIDYKCKRR
ncbi:hypothetical protein H0A36_20030 [Endozoicomonas sp. SM1973]|uniref:Uncharacterized protein n=1 Tax=Spartinivicinus marinus TaxID=2994442 RepID=A0A853I6D4_9GAMM|nr:hypothetical protein [Spartinivicinus marinus]MCX4025669.1 hypothetical protein [Spartinivicinus marinus]NYZ68309.1 hypothetical protein [Spartinivicinus marinus]